MEDRPKEKLEEFSELLIKLGEEIEMKISEKRKLEEIIKQKEEQVRSMGKDIFSAKRRTARLSSELAKLEERRKRFEEEKLLLEKEEERPFKLT